jgi:hypothetical protein
MGAASMSNNTQFDDWASHIATGVETKSESQLEWEITEGLKKAFKAGQLAPPRGSDEALREAQADTQHLLVNCVPVAEMAAEINVLRKALKDLLAAMTLPEICAHGEEPDHCDACSYVMEKATRVAVRHAQQLLEVPPHGD